MKAVGTGWSLIPKESQFKKDFGTENASAWSIMVIKTAGLVSHDSSGRKGLLWAPPKSHKRATLFRLSFRIVFFPLSVFRFFHLVKSI
jgi:hypothetical protein